MQTIGKHNTEVIAVVGPTATGKTVIGAQVAKILGSEVISVDSQLVYRDLMIGVARPTPAETLDVPHHMIGVASPLRPFSAGEYADAARPVLERLLGENRIPVLVGGTGFYLRALLQPEHLPHVPVDEAYRAHLRRRLETEGPDALYQELERLDPRRAQALHPNDTIRVMRSLEIIRQTGEPIAQTPEEPAYITRVFGLTYANRGRHVEKIRERLARMMDEGFLEEVESLYQRYGECYALTRAHGYPELLDVILGKRKLEDALAQIETNIRQYSKRQMTWFRRVPGINWYAVDEQTADEIITDIVLKIR